MAITLLVLVNEVESLVLVISTPQPMNKSVRLTRSDWIEHADQEIFRPLDYTPRGDLLYYKYT